MTWLAIELRLKVRKSSSYRMNRYLLVAIFWFKEV